MRQMSEDQVSTTLFDEVETLRTQVTALEAKLAEARGAFQQIFAALAWGVPEQPKADPAKARELARDGYRNLADLTPDKEDDDAKG